MSDVAYWEAATFLLLVAACSAWEWLRPGWRTDRLADLRIDLLSFAVAVLSAHVSRQVLIALVGGAAPEFLARALDALRGLPFAAKLLLGILTVDFCVYWVHRVQHRFAFAWRSHRWHHSAEHMYWLAGFRTSFLHSFVYNIPQVVVPIHVLGLSPLESAAGYAIGLFVQFWVHANAKACIACLKYVFIRPQDHRLHHSAAGPAVNFGFVFSFWDRWFGTYVDGDTRQEEYPLGLGEDIRPQAVPRMLLGV